MLLKFSWATGIESTKHRAKHECDSWQFWFLIKLEKYLDSFVLKEIHIRLSSKPDDKNRTQFIITINGQLDDI